MIKKLSFLILVCGQLGYAQIDENSVLGLPVATTAEMLAVTRANEGAVVYNTDDKNVYRWNGTIWEAIGNGSSGDITGDIKYSVRNRDHNGWYVLNGRAINTLPTNARTAAIDLGFTSSLPDASDRVLKHPRGGETIGDIGGQATTTLTRANLPDINFNGTTTTGGNHRHSISGIFQNFQLINRADNFLNVMRSGGNTNTSRTGNHSHNVTVNSGGGDQAFERYQPFLVINSFIYLGE